MDTAAPNTEMSILSRVVDPEKGDVPREAAELILRLDFHDRDRKRMRELVAKNQEGELSPEEEVELENYRHVGRFLDLIRSKARRALQDAPTS